MITPAQQPPAAAKATAAPAAAPAAQTKAFVVSLPLSARDKHGALIKDLDRNDLTLTDEGRGQVIQGLTRNSGLPFQIGLLDDTGAGMKNALDYVRKGGDKFIDEMLAAGPTGGAQAAADTPAAGANEAFLLHFDSEVELLQDFTASADTLHKELDQMGPTSQAQDERQGPETMGDNRPSAHGAPGGSNLYDAIFLASDELMKSKTGRKALVVVSDGLDKGSKETMNDALDAAERAHVIVYTICLSANQPRSNPFPNQGRRGGMGYPGGGYPGGGYPGGGYPGGGYPGGGNPNGGQPAPPPSSGVDGRKIMEQISKRTGALYFDARRKEDMEQIYGIIAEDLKGLYTLTYTPDKIDNDGGFHKVVLKSDKKDLSLVMPEGYFAPGGDAQ
jgi:VWFA-related protein